MGDPVIADVDSVVRTLGIDLRRGLSDVEAARRLDAIAVSAALQMAVVHVPLFNVAFGTVPLTFTQWAVCIAMASSVLWVGELRKAVLRARGPALLPSKSPEASKKARTITRPGP